jgi:hypothetical protein
MCIYCSATQVPVCAATSSCGVQGLLHSLGLIFTLLGVFVGTSRLWLYNVIEKVAPALNTTIFSRKSK